MSPRPLAEQEVARILALIPYLVDHPGARVADVAQRFSVRPEQLRRDLDLVLMVGVPPYSPGDYIDVEVSDDDEITLRMADSFRRALRLTTGEGLALISAARLLLKVPGSEESGHLASALAKLSRTLDLSGVAVDVDTPPLLDDVREALDAHERIEIDYWSAGRDAHTTRTVDPAAVFFALGAWYLAAHCHLAGAERLFRIDRVRAVRPTGEHVLTEQPFEWRPDQAPAVFTPRPDDPRVVIELAPAAAWVAEVYPIERAQTRPDGTIEIELAVHQTAWLERLLLRVGPDARVIAPDSYRDLGASAARRVLARYERNADEHGAR